MLMMLWHIWASYDTEIKLKTKEKGEFKKQTNCFLKNKKRRPCLNLDSLTGKKKKKISTFQLIEQDKTNIQLQ